MAAFERKRVSTISFALDLEVRTSDRGEKETKLFMMFSSPWGLTRLLFENGCSLKQCDNGFCKCKRSSIFDLQ